VGKGRGGGKTPERVVELIRKAVAEKSQSAVARDSGLTLLTVQRYLKGIGEPTTASLQKLANYFKVSVPWLRGDELLTYEVERALYDWKSTAPDWPTVRPSEKQWWDASEEQIAAFKKDKEKLREYKDKKKRLEVILERYRDLFFDFAAVPEEEKGEILNLLHFVQENMAANSAKNRTVQK